MMVLLALVDLLQLALKFGQFYLHVSISELYSGVFFGGEGIAVKLGLEVEIKHDY